MKKSISILIFLMIIKVGMVFPQLDTITCNKQKYFFFGTDTINTFDSLGMKHGSWNYYDKYGHLLTKIHYKHGIINGLLENYHYFKNPHKRIIQSSVMYVDGRKNGIYREYSRNGNLRLEWSYVNDSLHGLMIHYYNNGRISGIYYYIHQLRDGVTKLYYKNGNTKSEIWFTMNKKVLQFDYDKKGRIRTTTYWKDYQIKNREVFYNKDGSKAFEFIYDGNAGNTIVNKIEY